MRWKGRRQSDNIEDRRGQRVSGGAVAGGGIGTIIIVLLVMMLGGDPSAILGGAQGGGGGQMPGLSETQGEIDPEIKEFVSVILADTEDVWHEQFRKQGLQYQEPKLVLFSGQVQSACGFASAAVGPFYCPGDSQVYLDTSFFQLMEQRFRAGGDFAQAYVIAHEVGHHVQNLLGISEQVDAQRRRLSEKDFNALMVRLELQADFYAGVWAHHASRYNSMDRQDLEEALTAANAIGDDTLQKQSQGYVVPDSFTHGTSAQRVRWFRKGFESGDMTQGDTFGTNQL